MPIGADRNPTIRLLLAAASWSLIAHLALAQETSTSNAQPSSANLPRFEVASIRPSASGRGELNGFYTYPGGRIAAKGCTIRYLLMLAFDVQDFQVDGGPPWADLVRGRVSTSRPFLLKTPLLPTRILHPPRILPLQNSARCSSLS